MAEETTHSFTEDVYYIDARMRCACGWASFGFFRYWKANRHMKQVRRMDKLNSYQR